ncbi:MAG: hypothetical protein A2887_04695 [Alphaproteobacteria bacterium RIFCSPLOWO2_01_FULL_40_26]|nr:MAG: hypothetical protein A3D15_04470 [Alphaproteobacteria bacterium RIFCSPHIGHO2_02_FULL_40_34]OFW87530.1 MAG: hypothetical protein A2794_03890 [Alphaproteobacteria bacterium RIFCSPHIGHO2_01_FULL_40_8]OFW94360.1 MAG: hypothetical protein A2887_04695 [Alphaproteobacteria bacterium RIFCSPLOWO2_01_FULL_40_26]OFX09492.1 MAG: hypothetical protein A3H30_02260 [Alphaproteobacteria bacterium RIFCSPLOWO2_02_FULL_40_19]OFX11123.1 MAG: hypothetical protein A3G22_02820 [Alphaproteobacteria bacterium RI
MTRCGCHPELVSGSNFRHNILCNNSDFPSQNFFKIFYLQIKSVSYVAAQLKIAFGFICYEAREIKASSSI